MKNKSIPPSSPDSNTWLQEFAPHVNGKRTRWPDVKLDLVAGETCTLMLDYEYSWLIGNPDAFLALEYKPGAEGQGLVFDPPLGQLCEMAEGTTSLSWTISTDQAPSGPFELQFALPKFDELPKSPLLPGEIINVAQEIDVIFDEFPLTFETGAAAYPCHGARHTFTVRLKPSSQLLDMNMKLIWGGEPAESLGVVVTPAPGGVWRLSPEGMTWTLDCRNSVKSGDFALTLRLLDLNIDLPLLPMNLAHNLVTAVYTREHQSIPPDIIIHTVTVTATSVFLQAPASGVRVINRALPTLELFTDSDGKVVRTGRNTISLYIVNHYNNTEV